jgi:hypothetical protein
MTMTPARDAFEGTWIDCEANIDLGNGEDRHDGYLDFDRPHAPMEPFDPGEEEPLDPREPFDTCWICDTWTCPDDRCSRCPMPPIDD